MIHSRKETACDVDADVAINFIQESIDIGASLTAQKGRSEYAALQLFISWVAYRQGHVQVLDPGQVGHSPCTDPPSSTTAAIMIQLRSSSRG